MWQFCTLAASYQHFVERSFFSILTTQDITTQRKKCVTWVKGKAIPIQSLPSSQISRQSAHESGKVVSLYTHEIFLLLISVRGWINLTAAVSPKGLCQWKIPMTPSGFIPTTVQLVPQCLNQLRDNKVNVQNIYQSLNHHYNIIPTAAVTSLATWAANLSLNSKATSFAHSDRWVYQLAGSSTVLQFTGLTAIRLNYRNIGGDGDSRKLRQIEITENSLCYCSRVTLCSTTALTVTSYQLTWYSRKIRLHVFSSFFNHVFPKFKVRSVSPDFRVEANRLKRAAPQM